MTMALFGVIAFSVSAMFVFRETDATPSVTVPGLGDLRGKRSSRAHEVAVFAGIPFAKPPIGDLRWMPPQPYGAWESPRDATQYRDACVGAKTDGIESKGESEDCLFLNVAVRASGLGVSANQSVMLWVYGGTYSNGAAKIYQPEMLVSASAEPVVVVTINYRINIFGFLGSKALSARSQDGSTGNYGLQDQRLALTWVRDHISAFGGHGGDVAIFGESAGGNSVLHHLVQPASFGLYSKAIMESGTYDAGYSLTDAEALYNAISVTAGCGANLECLLKKNSSELEDAVKKGGAPGGAFSKLAYAHWGPVVDGVSMTGTPQELVAAGKFNNKVPVLMGSNRDEWSAFITGPHAHHSLPTDMNESQFDQAMAPLGEDTIRAVKRLYDPSVYAYPADLGKYSQWWWTAMRVVTDNGIPLGGWPVGPALGHCSARRIAEQLVRGGTPSLYLYNFERTLIDPVLVGHGMEIPFVFNWWPLFALSPGSRRLSKEINNYWVRFATSGSPNLPGAKDALPQWPKYVPGEDRAIINFDATFSKSKITITQNFRGAACDFWDSLAMKEQRHSSVIIV